jgi:hypothetical protein
VLIVILLAEPSSGGANGTPYPRAFRSDIGPGFPPPQRLHLAQKHRVFRRPRHLLNAHFPPCLARRVGRRTPHPRLAPPPFERFEDFGLGNLLTRRDRAADLWTS